MLATDILYGLHGIIIIQYMDTIYVYIYILYEMQEACAINRLINLCGEIHSS